MLIVLFALPSAYAGFHLEPWVGYAITGLGDTNGDGVEDDKDESAKGPAFGARVGWAAGAFQVGAEFFMAKQTLSFDTAGSTEIDANQDGYGVFIGLDFPVVPIRVYGTYFISSKIEFDPSIGTAGLFTVDELSEGAGWKLGIGFTGLPFVILNLEYQSIHYEKIKGTLLGSTFESEITDGDDYSTVLFSISIPL